MSMRISAVIAKPGQRWLLRDISNVYLERLEGQGWEVRETWPFSPSLGMARAALKV